MAKQAPPSSKPERFNPWWITVIAPVIAFALFSAGSIAILRGVWGGLVTEATVVATPPMDVAAVLQGISGATHPVAIVRFASTDLATNDGEQRLIKTALSPPAKASQLSPMPSGGLIGEAKAQEANEQTTAPQLSAGGLRWSIFEVIYDQNGAEVFTIAASRGPLRFGEAVHSGEIAGNVHLINIITDFPSPDPKSSGPRLRDEARRLAILGGMKAALIKADALSAQRILVSPGPLDNLPATKDGHEAVVFEAIDAAMPSLPFVRRVDVLSATSELSKALIEHVQESPLRVGLRRAFGTRLPPYNSDALKVVMADPSAMEQLARTSAPVAATKAVFASTPDLAPRVTYLPLFLGITAYGVALLLTAAQAVNGGWRFKPMLEQGRGLYAFISGMPLLVVFFNALSWLEAGAPWAPNPGDVFPLISNPLLTYGLAPLAGFISGYAVNFLAFDKQPLAAEAPPSLRSILIPDVPVSGGVKKDRLGFTQLVTALARFIDNRNTEPPVVLAITGPWGSGKSSVMRMLQAELKETKRFRFAWFNAWENQEQDKILAAFLRTVGQELRSQVGFLFPLRLAWVRLRDASYWQLAKIFSPVLLIGVSALLWRHYGADKAAGEWWDVAQTVAASAAGVTGLAGLANLARWLKPFQEPLSWILASPSKAAETTYLDQFRSEFKLYRKTVNAEKYVIFIDDLDRCPPNSVVEVLKTVNLIVTSDDGPGKMFFVLGFDWNYIVTCVEMHFAQFIAADAGVKGRFGPNYLKKIVTLPVSVPQPSQERLESFVKGLDDRDGAQSVTGAPADGGFIKRAAKVLSRPLTQFVVTAILLITLVSVTERFQTTSGPGVTPPVVDGGPTVSTGGETGDGTETTRIIDLTPPDPLLVPTWPLWVQWAALLMAVAAMAGATWQMRDVARGEIAPPEPEDSAKFVQAVSDLSDRMPKNPRDVIRLLNLMRVTFFIQEAGPSGKDIFTGQAFSEEESVKLSLFQYQNNDLLLRHEIEEKLLPLLDQGKPLVRGANGAWLDSFTSAVDSLPGTKTIIEKPAKLRRFLEIYRNLLPARHSAKEAPPDVS